MGFRYIGSKARIAEDIISCLGPPAPGSGQFIDAFSGTGVVASAAADLGWAVKVNDMMQNAAVVSESRLLSAADVPFTAFGGYGGAVEAVGRCAEKEGFIWREYSPASLQQAGVERKYFTEENAKKIDGAAALIHQWRADHTVSRQEFSLLMATLISAVNEVANIAGTYGCFLSRWTEASQKPLQLSALPLRERAVPYCVSSEDVFAVKSAARDVVYLDPPYTKRQYAAYYHVLETIVQGDSPAVKGVSGLRPWKHNASVFCYKTKALQALTKLTVTQPADRVLISYSNDGHIQLHALEEALRQYGSVHTTALGAIGRYRPNQAASANQAEVQEYLIDFSRTREERNEQTPDIRTAAPA